MTQKRLDLWAIWRVRNANGAVLALDKNICLA